MVAHREEQLAQTEKRFISCYHVSLFFITFCKVHDVYITYRYTFLTFLVSGVI